MQNNVSVLLGHLSNDDSFILTEPLPAPNRDENRVAGVILRLDADLNRQFQPDYFQIDEAVMGVYKDMAISKIRPQFQSVLGKGAANLYKLLERHGHQPKTRNVSEVLRLLSGDSSVFLDEKDISAIEKLPVPEKEGDSMAGRMLAIRSMLDWKNYAPATIDSEIMSLEVELQLAEGSAPPPVIHLLGLGVKMLRSELKNRGYVRSLEEDVQFIYPE